MSETVKVPHDFKFHFPAQCVCCLEKAEEWRDTQVMTPPQRFTLGVTSTGAIRYIETPLELHVSDIPYCTEHAKQLDAHLVWQRAYNEYRAEHFGGVIGALIESLLEGRTERAVEKLLSDAGQPLRIRDAQFNFYPSVFLHDLRKGVGGALGLYISVEGHVEGHVELAVVKVKTILLMFQNPQYAALFRETNGLPVK